MAMKYIAYDIVLQNIVNHEVVNGFWVRGQRAIDYNWSVICECNSMEEAIKKAFELRGDVTPGTVTVYGADGYGIQERG